MRPEILHNYQDLTLHIRVLTENFNGVFSSTEALLFDYNRRFTWKAPLWEAIILIWLFLLPRPTNGNPAWVLRHKEASLD